MTTATALTLATYWNVLDKAKDNATSLSRVADLTRTISDEAFNAAVVSTSVVAFTKTIAALKDYTETLEKLLAELKKQDDSPLSLEDLDGEKIRKGAVNATGNIIMLEFLVSQLAELVGKQENENRDERRSSLKDALSEALGELIKKARAQAEGDGCDGDPNAPGPHHAKDCPMYREPADEQKTEPAQAAAE